MSYFQNALRLIKKHTWFSIMNILGLTLGISSCLLVILYLNFELQFDKFHERGDNIYRVVMNQPGNQVLGSSSDWWVVSPAILKPTWEAELPEVDLMARSVSRDWIFRLGEKWVDEKVLSVDPTFLDIFTFKLKQRAAKDAIKTPNSIIISPEIASKYFGEENPIGKELLTNDEKQFTVVGVLEDIPANSHLQFDMLVSFKTLELKLGRNLLSDNWLNNPYRTYLTLQENTDLDQLDRKLRKYDVDGFNGKKWSFHLQPLFDIHFNRQIWGTGNLGSLFIFGSVGIFILLIACFNYLNLYIAHYRSRSKNVSVRKVIGATPTQLMTQFLSESFYFVLFAYLLSIGLVGQVLPLFNDFIGQELDFYTLFRPITLATALGIIVTMSLLSGIYPALYLSRLNPVNGIKGGLEKLSRGGQYLRKTSVVIQFSASILLIIGSITAIKQLQYVGNRNLGYQKENIICLETDGLFQRENGELKNKIKLFKEELRRIPEITAVAASSAIPSDIGWSNIPTWAGKAKDENPFFYRLRVDFDFLELYEIPILEGRNFSASMTGDEGNAYLLNRAAVNRIGLASPVGAQFGFDDKLGNVVGVTQDFHFESLHKPITPLGIGVREEDFFNYLSIKVKGNDFSHILAEIETTWQGLVPDHPLKFSFFDNDLAQLYEKDRLLAKSMNYFSVIALFISCLGIFGLMSFSLKERTKEIGVRKILGASFTSLLNLLTFDLFQILGIAILFGGSLGWYFSQQWLDNFAYRFEMGWGMIAIAALITIATAIFPLSYKLLRSIRSNPVEALRTE